MLLMAPPVLEALACVGAGEGRPGLLRVLLAPDGERFEQASARRWATELDHLVVVSGRYEGIDDRIRTRVDRVVSLGDFVLMGGEAAAWAIAEAVLRLVPGVVEERSLAEESFEDGLLEAPQFTRPPRLGDGGSDPERSLSVHADPKADAREAVPEILRSGDHGRVARARRRAALARTLIDRPDLLRGFDPAPDDARRLGEVLETVGQRLQTLEEGIGPSGSGIRPGSGDDWAWRMLY